MILRVRSKEISYSSWYSMIKRCTNNRSKDFQKYGGRGIKVCDRWIESYDDFLSDMGPRPSLDYSIDRIDNDGDYTPDNCRWADRVDQNRNRKKGKVCGVYFRKHRGNWQARISVDEKEILLGTFDNEFDAISARKSAEKRYWRI